jgi:rRNA maturation endonuclease Nob1
MRVVLQHVYQGFPLALPTAVIEEYVAAGELIATPLFECEKCGYGLPRTFHTCPLCGGRTGLGAYAVRRARVAMFN